MISGQKTSTVITSRGSRDGYKAHRVSEWGLIVVRELVVVSLQGITARVAVRKKLWSCGDLKSNITHHCRRQLLR